MVGNWRTQRLFEYVPEGYMKMSRSNFDVIVVSDNYSHINYTLRILIICNSEPSDEETEILVSIWM